MTLSERLTQLINEGEKLETQVKGDCITGPQYEEWINDCRIVLDENFSKNALNIDFIEVNKNDRRETRWGYEKNVINYKVFKKVSR